MINPNRSTAIYGPCPSTLTTYLIEFFSANKKPFRIAFGFVFCGYENFIVHNCEMKKSFNFDKVSFLSEQPEKSTDFLSSFLETQVGFQEPDLKWSVICVQGRPLVVTETPIFRPSYLLGLKISIHFDTFLKTIKSHLLRLSTIKYQKSELVILTIWFVALLSDTQISTVWTSSHWPK